METPSRGSRPQALKPCPDRAGVEVQRGEDGAKVPADWEAGMPRGRVRTSGPRGYLAGARDFPRGVQHRGLVSAAHLGAQQWCLSRAGTWVAEPLPAASWGLLHT